jgi:hypothetical protein
MSAFVFFGHIFFGHKVRTLVILFSLVLVSGSVAQAFLRITASKSDALNVLSIVVGWIYFVAWSVSFYPQVIAVRPYIGMVIL